MSQQFTIGDLSREFALTTRAIRFYEDQGLLAPRREGQSRIYGSRDRTRLKLIVRGKRLGFRLAEIAEMLDMYDAPEGERGQLQTFIRRIRERRSDLVRQREDIDNVIEELDELEQRCERLLDGPAETPREVASR